MSSDCFYVRVGEVQGDRAVLHCLTGFAGGLNDRFTSRSFALFLLLDAKSRAGDASYDVGGAPEKIAEQRLALAKRAGSAASALHDELPDPQPWDTKWSQANVPRFVASTRLLRVNNDLPEDQLGAIAQEIEPLQEKGPWPHLDAAWKRLHSYDLEVVATDPKYLRHLVTGHHFGTTAFSPWEG
jgi:hypothetical protein